MQVVDIDKGSDVMQRSFGFGGLAVPWCMYVCGILSRITAIMPPFHVHVHVGQDRLDAIMLVGLDTPI